MESIWQNHRPEVVTTSPFPFATFPSALSSRFVQQLHEWFRADAPWDPHVGENFSHERIEFGMIELPTWLKEWMSVKELSAIRQLLAGLFQVRTPTRMRVFANRIKAGNGIGLHTDLDTGIVACVTILDEASPPNGGHFVIASSDSIVDIVNVFPATHNQGYAMLLTPKSYHAVSEVLVGVRYSVCFLLQLD